MSCSALIVAAGRGTRLGAPLAKQFLPLGDRPLLVWTLQAFERCTHVDDVVLVVASEHHELAAKLIDQFALRKVRRLEPGGAERTDSVCRGLAALPGSCRLVAIHDGARPLVQPELIARLVDEAARCGAAIPALPARDTVKRGADGWVSATEDRRSLHLVQTPQVFAVELIRRAYAQRAQHESLTDDAQLVEQLGVPVRLVEGDPCNLKVTVAEDLRIAERLLLPPEPALATRVGTGYDVHRLVPGRELILGGVSLPHPVGLLGHSDADVLCHAIGDALLGAATLGDLGHHFPPGDPAFAGISSLVLLERIARLVGEAGYSMGNIDATVICEAPKLAPHIGQMRENIAKALGLTAAQVSVKATTTEGLGFTGERQGIAAQAVVTLGPARRERLQP